MLPPQFGYYGNSGNSGNYGTVFFHLLPYVEQNSLYQQSKVPAGGRNSTYPGSWSATPGAYDLRGSGIEGTMLTILLCPADDAAPQVTGHWGWAGASYAGNLRVFGNVVGTDAVKPVESTDMTSTTPPTPPKWQGKSRLPALSDGTSNTIFFTERIGMCNDDGSYPSGHANGGNMWTRWDWLDAWQPAFAAFSNANPPFSDYMFQGASSANPWTYPSNCDPYRPQSLHNGDIVNFAMGDGGVRLFNTSMTTKTFWALCTPNSGDQPGLDGQ